MRRIADGEDYLLCADVDEYPRCSANRFCLGERGVWLRRPPRRAKAGVTSPTGNEKSPVPPRPSSGYRSAVVPVASQQTSAPGGNIGMNFVSHYGAS